ncbi:MAG TPA: ORF6N domain-containing protein [Thermodesulfovibrionales bacterium]|nr:ORF6N domain-containing protein [Thermodesulfovibrionales bacterium]
MQKTLIVRIYSSSVETRDINKAVTNNPEKFPAGYIIEVSKSEKNELVENFHRLGKLKLSTVFCRYALEAV